MTCVVSGGGSGIGLAADGPLVDCSADAWANVLNVNVTGAANLLRAAIPALQRSGSGDIVLVASTAATIGRPGIAAYSVSKAGLVGLQLSIVADYAADGIRCNCVCPGPTRTPMAKSQSRPLPNARGRPAGPDEIAAVIDWLTHDESNWAIGQTIAVDAAAVVGRAFNHGYT